MGDWRKNNPGRPCCCDADPDCVLLDDDFSSDTIANYTQVSGTWSISGGYLTTGSSSGLIVWATDAGAKHAVYGIHLLVAGKTNVWKYVVGYASANDYVYVRARNGNISIWEVVGGVESQLTSEVTVTPSAPGGLDPSSSAWELSVCWSGTTKRVAWKAETIDQGTASAQYATATGSGFGNYAGFGTGTLASASVAFAEIIIYKQDENCKHCECNVCDVDTTPDSVTIEFDGVAADGCGECGTFNSTEFVLDRSRFIDPTCYWSFEDLDEVVICGQSYYGDDDYYLELLLLLVCDDPTNNRNARVQLQVRRVVDSVTENVAVFQASLPCCKIDCLTVLDGLALPLISQDDDACDWSNATCTITGVA